jgi:hypothetical protein
LPQEPPLEGGAQRRTERTAQLAERHFVAHNPSLALQASASGFKECEVTAEDRALAGRHLKRYSTLPVFFSPGAQICKWATSCLSCRARL